MNGAISFTVDPSGKFAYVTSESFNDVRAWAIDGAGVDSSTGMLTALGTVAVGDLPFSLAVDASGRFAYVANGGSEDVSIFQIDGVTGALTPAGTAPTGMDPIAMTTTSTID